MSCKCHLPELGFDCVCDWVKKNPGNNEYSCSWCGFYRASRPRCNECTPAEGPTSGQVKFVSEIEVFQNKEHEHATMIVKRELAREKGKDTRIMTDEKGPRFLIEIKQKKDIIYKCEITSQNKETAQEWGNHWIKANHQDPDCKVITTEVLVIPPSNEGLKLAKDAVVVSAGKKVIKPKK